MTCVTLSAPQALPVLVRVGVRDYGDGHRGLHRVTVAGDVPHGLAK